MKDNQIIMDIVFRPIINHTVWLYHRFTLSFGDIEDLLAERSLVVTYKSFGSGV